MKLEDSIMKLKSENARLMKNIKEALKCEYVSEDVKKHIKATLKELNEQ